MSNETTVLNDEYGIRREYTHVKRVAAMGEIILVVQVIGGMYAVGDIGTVTTVHSDDSGILADRIRGGRAMPLFHTEYVVLEPTDIVNIDGGRYKTVSRKARIGDRVLITSKTQYYEIGRTFMLHPKAEPLDGGHVNYADGTYGMFPDQYVVLEKVEPVAPAVSKQPATPSTDELTTLIAKLAASHSALEKRVVSLETNVAGHERQIGTMDVQLRLAREDIVLIETGVTDDIGRLERAVFGKSVITEKPVKALSRQDVINRAKADVTTLLKTTNGNVPIKGRTSVTSAYRPQSEGVGYDRVEFTVDREKQSVLANIISSFIYDTVWATGKATCAPDDVFNIFIGKAIALRRALGLDVPDVYTKSPQPSQVNVGDIVTFKDGTPTIYRVDHPGTEGRNCTILKSACGQSGGAYGGNFSWARIVDDSREAVSVC